MRAKLFFLFLFLGVFTFSQQRNIAENFYRDILDFVVQQYDINSVGNGFEKIGFEKRSTSFSNDGKNITIEYNLPDEARLLVVRNTSNAKTNKIYLLHKIDMSFFLINYLSDIAYTYESNQIWYNKNKTIIITYEVKNNTVGILEILGTI